jgi:hypothetical protein
VEGAQLKAVQPGRARHFLVRKAKNGFELVCFRHIDG